MNSSGNDAVNLFHFSEPASEPYTAQITQGYPAAGSWSDILHEIGTSDNRSAISDLSNWFQDGPHPTPSLAGLDHVHDLFMLGDDQFFGFDQSRFSPNHRPEEGHAPSLAPAPVPESSDRDPLDEWLALVTDHPFADAQTDTDTDVLLSAYHYTSDPPSSEPLSQPATFADEEGVQPVEKHNKKRPAKASMDSTKASAGGREKQRKRLQQTVSTYDDCEEEDEDGDDVVLRPPTAAFVGSQGLNCKNLVSERNKRKRLSQQLLMLRALVPNITKMDKRSVLVDALSYLKGIHEETAKIQSDLSREQRQDQVEKGNDGTGQPNQVHHRLANNANDINFPGSGRSAANARVLEVDVERMEHRRFVVKVTCAGGMGTAGKVLRAMETLGFDITYAAVELIRPRHYLITTFIRVKKHRRMTESKLKDYIIAAATKSGHLTLLEDL